MKTLGILAITAAVMVVVASVAISLTPEAFALVVQTNRQEQRQSNNQQGAINVGANVGAQVGNACVICG